MARLRSRPASLARAGRASSRSHSLSRLAPQALTRSPQVNSDQEQTASTSRSGQVNRSAFRGYHFRHVYVGNLRPDITQDHLLAFFRGVGEVTRVIVRFTAGNIGAVQREESTPARLYASVEFRSSLAATRALRLDGSSLRGTRVVVTQNVLNLPELLEFRREYQEMRSRVWNPNTASAASQITAERTLILSRSNPVPADLPDRQPNGNQKQTAVARPCNFRFMGISFANTIV